MKNNNCVIAARLATSSWSRKAPACRPEPIRQAQGKLRAKHVVEGSIVAILLAMFLTACGDSSGDSKSAAPEVVDPVAETYATEDDLPGCIAKFEGNVALVEKDSVAFKCEDGRWVNKGKYIATEENIKNCTEKREGEVAYIVDEDKSLICEGGKWVKASDKVPEPAEGTNSSSSVTLSEVEGSSASNAASSSLNEVTESSSSIKDKGGEPAEPAEVSSSSNATSSSSWSEAIGSSSSSRHSGLDSESSSSVKTPGSSSAEESSSSVVVAMPCKTDEEDNCEYGILKDSRDGQEYKTVKIGEQWWMAENLNYAYTGVPVDNGPYTSDSTSWCYDNVPANCAKYGRLYTWAAAMDSVGEWSTSGKGCGYGKTCSVASADSATLVRGVCPKGWHLPSNDEWEVLLSAAGGSSTAGSKLKSATGWKAYSGITNEDAFGFSALPAGYRYFTGSYDIEGNFAGFWSCTEDGSNGASEMNLYYNDANAPLYGKRHKSSAYSVRCVKD